MAAFIQANGNVTPIDVSKYKLTPSFVGPLVSEPFTAIKLSATEVLFVSLENYRGHLTRELLNQGATEILHDRLQAQFRPFPFIYGDAVFAYAEELVTSDNTTA